MTPGCRFSKVFGSKSLEKNLGVLERENAKLCYKENLGKIGRGYKTL
jgi:hypothetical protein